MPRVEITLNDGSSKIVEFDNGFSDADVDEVATQLNAQLKPIQQPTQTVQQPIEQPQQVDKQAEIDRIQAKYDAKNKEIDAENRKAMGRIAAGGLLQGASMLPVFNIPYVGTGLGGALFETGAGLVEGNSGKDIAKRALQGAVVGETIGAIPYVGKALGKTKVGQKVAEPVVNTVGKVANKVMQNPTAQKVGQVLTKERELPFKLQTEAKILTPEEVTIAEQEIPKVSEEVIANNIDVKPRSLQQSVINAEGTPQEVREALAKENAQYAVLHNNDLTQQAIQEVDSNFNNELSRLTGAKDFDALDYEKSRQLAKRLFDAGRHEEAVNLIDNVSENATKKGQAIQALSLWSNMTPEGAVYKAQKLLNEYNKKSVSKKKLSLTAEQIDKIRALQDDALNQTDDLLKSQALARTAKYVSELVPANIGKKLKAYRNISLLLNPKTLGRNIVGNALFNAVDTVSKGVAVPIDRAIGKFTGQNTRVLPQLKEMAQGGVQGAKTGFKEALEGIDTRGLGQRFDLQGGRTFKNPVGQAFETALDVGLRTPDRMQYEATFAESVANMMKAKGLEKPTQEILEQAEKEALESVFQNESAISDLTLNARKALNTIGTKDFGLGDLAIPYAQTPANLVQQAINYSPAGLIKGGINLAKGDQRQASLDLARALVGSGLIGTGYGLSKADLMTPSQFSDDYNKNKLIKNNLRVLGIQPEQIGNMWYAPFQPVSTSLSIGNAMAEGENPVQAGLNTMLDLPFLQNVSRGLSDIKDKGIAEAGVNFASSVPSQFVPTALGQVSQLLDNTQRETYDQNKLKQGLNQAIVKTPLSQTLPEKIDVTGQPIQRYETEGIQRVFDTFFNPTFINEKKDDVVINELKALYDITGETKQFLPVVDKKLSFTDKEGNKQKLELTGEQLSMYQQALGKKMYEEYEQLMNSPMYQNATDERRLELLNKQKSNVKDKVDFELFNKRSQYAKKVKSPVEKLKRKQSKIDNMVLRSMLAD